MKLFSRLLATVGAALALATVPVAQPRYHLGISVSAMGYAERTFADMLKHDARVWVPGTSNAAPIDAFGFPTTDCDLFFLDGGFASSTRTASFAGTYRLSFTGQADLPGGWGLQIQNKAYNSATNTTTAELVVTQTHPTLMLQFRNTRRTPSSALNTGVTNLKIMRPVSAGSTTSYPTSRIFTDDYLGVHRGAHVIRFMDFTATNGNQQREWTDRRLPQEIGFSREGGDGQNGNYWWQGKGAPWEYAIALSNELDADMWLNVPLFASDDYVRQLARLVRDNLESGRKVYVEWSNEVWNFGFPHFGQVSALAAAELNANPNTPLNFDGRGRNGQGQPDGGILVPRYWARRIMQISDIFRQEFGDAQMMTRVRPLFETQAAWQHWISTGVLFLDAYYNNGAGNFVQNPRPLHAYLWGAGGSAYNHGMGDGLANLTVDQLVQRYNASWSEQYSTMLRDTHWARAFGLARVAYEAGPGLDDHAGLDTPMAVVQRDPRMFDIYRTQVDNFYQAGGELYVTFLGINSTHGLLPFDAVMGNQPKPKWDAFQAMLAAPSRPAPTAGFAVPGVVPGGRYSISSDGWSDGNSDGSVNLTGAYDWRAWTVRTQSPGRLSVRAEGTQGTVEVLINGVSRGSVALNAPSEVLSEVLPVGVHSVRLVRRGVGTATVGQIRLDVIGTVLQSLSPASAVTGSPDTVVTLTGLRFDGTSVALLNGSPRATEFVSATQIRMTVTTADLATAGTRQIAVRDGLGGVTAALPFEVGNPVPAIVGTVPGTARAGSNGFRVLVNGTGFVTDSAARWDGQPRPTTFISPTQIGVDLTTADLASARTGQIAVVNPSPAGGTSNAWSFRIENAVPIVTLLTPNRANAHGAPLTITVRGGRFVPTSVVRWRGKSMRTTFVNATTLRFTAATVDLSWGGLVPVTVVSPAPGGGTSRALNFSIVSPVPRITTLTPSSRATNGGAFTLRILGSGFVRTSSVRWNGAARTTQYISPTELRATIPAGDVRTPGPKSITVANPAPGGGTSAPARFMVGGPQITVTGRFLASRLNYSVAVGLRNSGDYVAGTVVVRTATLSGCRLLTTLPVTVTSIAPGTTREVPIAFTGGLPSGLSVALTVTGTVDGVPFTGTVTLRTP